VRNNISAAGAQHIGLSIDRIMINQQPSHPAPVHKAASGLTPVTRRCLSMLNKKSTVVQILELDGHHPSASKKSEHLQLQLC
jgi:hypothetical protein